MVTNMELAFKKMSYRHNSTCVIQKWLRFKRVITVRLAYISSFLKKFFFPFYHNKIHPVTNYSAIKNKINKTR